MPDSQKLKEKPKVRMFDVFRAYTRELKQSPWLFFFVFLGAAGVQAAAVTSPLFLRKLFNLLTVSQPTPETMHTLLLLVGAIALISFGGQLMRRLEAFSHLYLEARVMTSLYSSAFDYLLRHSHHFFISRFSGTLSRHITKFAHAFETMFDGIVLQFFPTALFTIGVLVVLFLRSYTLGAILGIWIIGFLIFQFFVARWRQPLRSARAGADSKMVGVLSDAISNQNTVALFSGTTHENKLFLSVVEFWRKAVLRSWTADEMIWSGLGLLMASINIGMLYGAVIFWQRGLITIGDFALIQVYLIGLFDRLAGLNRELRRLYDAYADASEMMEIMKLPHEIQDAANAPLLEVPRGEITFKNINFSFQNTRPVLNAFNLTLEPKEKLALVGPSGAGKSTVTKLLLRLYNVPDGKIEIDGRDIASVTQESLRNAIAFVPQEPILFHRTLMENIRYGRRDATDGEVFAAATKAHCHEFISTLPEGYQTYVGERGVKLSGGERQRVAIARAILKNAPILILDEATSSLDSESESLIQDALRTLMEGKTVLVIAHRLSTIMKMDRIVVIQSGTIIAEGSHSDLLKRDGGLYQKLWNIQAGGFREEAVADEEESEELADEPKLASEEK